MRSAWLAVGLMFLTAGFCPAQEMVVGPQIVPDGVAAPCEACAGHGHHGQCGHALLRWLTYHPETGGLCECCHKCVPCCRPPLYMFFLCQGCGGYGCAATCSTCMCSGPAHRIYHCHPEKNCHDGGCGHP